MKIYLVREADTTKLHGIFWAKNPTRLWDAVDEMSDPSHYEFAEILRPGGIWHELSNDETLPALQWDSATEDEQEECDFSGMHPLNITSEDFGNMFAWQDEHEWKRFDAANEGVGLISRLMKRKKGDRLP